MTKYGDRDSVYVVCKYERWASYWFKARVNYILSNKLDIEKFNARHKRLRLKNDAGELIEVIFKSETEANNLYPDPMTFSPFSKYIRFITWDDEDVDKLYSKIMEAING